MSNETLLKSAKNVLDKNWTGSFTKPAPSLYPHQWNWDSGFIALGYNHYSPQKAIQELKTLFSGQWKNGMLPQIRFEIDPKNRYFPGPSFWQTSDLNELPEGELTSGITMPPVHGFVLEEIWNQHPNNKIVHAFTLDLFPRIVSLMKYLYTFRDPMKEGILYIRHPWESGTDNSPVWDQSLYKIKTDEIPAYQRKDLLSEKAINHRPDKKDYDLYVYLVDLFRKNHYDEQRLQEKDLFKIQDPLFNGIALWSLESLTRLGEAIHQDVQWLRETLEMGSNNIKQKLWNKELSTFQAYDLNKESIIDTTSLSGLTPLVTKMVDQNMAQAIVNRLKTHFGLGSHNRYACPTIAFDDPCFNPEKYWRGATWINMNWIIIRGLIKKGFKQEAVTLKNITLQLVQKRGFFEYFNPLNGEGCGTNDFSWSAALAIDLIEN